MKRYDEQNYPKRERRGMASDMENYREDFSNFYPHTSDYPGDYYGQRPGKHFGKGPKGWKRSDERIREDASEALYKDWHVDASHIEVSVEDACIYLRGTVGTREDKKRAERCVEHLSGVEDVHNELRIKRETGPNSEESLADDLIDPELYRKSEARPQEMENLEWPSREFAKRDRPSKSH